jgi:hypothetical protein
MTKHLVFWTAVPDKPFMGLPTMPISREIDSNYRGTLISRILVMKTKTPISLEDAIALMQKHEDLARSAGQSGADRGQTFWFSFNFVEFISEQGYHIELTGDEFEIFNIAEVRA